MVSVVGGVLITVALTVFTDNWVVDIPDSVAAIAKIVFWPVAVCLYFSGPGPSMGPPERHLREGTPVQFIAVMIGLGLSWVFYSSLVFFIWRLWRRCRAAVPK